jgi:divalent metal cation (Fe/Co/Zn/Cd) transporter
MRRAVRLQWVTIGWNAVEVFVTIGLGIAAGSLALVAFGLDSIIEIWASLVVLWHVSALREEQGERTNDHALRLVGLAFLALALFLAVTSLVRLLGHDRPDESWAGIVYIAATVVVMFTLAMAKTRVSHQLGDHPLGSEARMTFLDALLASSVMFALLFNALWGWWWTDPLAALVIALLAALEGRENLEASRDGDRITERRGAAGVPGLPPPGAG